MHPNPVAWFEIDVQDTPRAKAFHEAVFQCDLTPLANPSTDGFPGMEMWAFPSAFERCGAPGARVKMPGYPSGGSTLVYFACEDCAVEAARAAANGGQVIKPKMSMGAHGFIAPVMDTEGNTIGLHSM